MTRSMRLDVAVDGSLTSSSMKTAGGGAGVLVEGMNLVVKDMVAPAAAVAKGRKNGKRVSEAVHPAREPRNERQREE